MDNRRAELREKLIGTILRGANKPGTPDWSREDAEKLLEIAPDLTNDELADCIGDKAVPVFRDIYYIIFSTGGAQ